MQGKVISVIGGICDVLVGERTFSCVPKGIFRHENKQISVGDNVLIDEKELVITQILDRKNSLVRPRCANVDLMMITMSAKEPDLSLELIYKFLTYANLNGISSAVLITKIDLLDDKKEILHVKKDLELLGIRVFLMARNDDSCVEEIKEFLANKTTIIMGQTGVGKSSAINRIDETFIRKVGEYSKALGRGKHKTKEVILHPFLNGFLGDTPGFSSLELDLYKEDLAQYFPGYSKFYLNCYFTNCLHQNEKECKIKEEIANGNLSKDAYEIYLKLLSTLKFRSERFKK